MEVNAKIGQHSQQIRSLEKRMENMETDNKTLNRLTAVLEEQMKRSIERDERQTAVLDRIDQNLTNLNSRFDQMEKRVDFLEEERREERKERRKVVYKIIGGVATAVLSAALLLWLNLK